MDNLQIYNSCRAVPQEAQKSIGGGRLKGMTDINPMWRIKKLTEMFGVCGIGWKYEIVNKWVETAMAKDEITANVEINLYIKVDGEWSEPIPALGGSMLVANEKSGLYVNDECYKMALTDALSVACKALGMGADIYWNKDNTKYNDSKKDNVETDPNLATKREKEIFLQRCEQLGVDYKEIAKQSGAVSMATMTKEQQGKCLIILKDIETGKQ